MKLSTNSAIGILRVCRFLEYIIAFVVILGSYGVLGFDIIPVVLPVLIIIMTITQVLLESVFGYVAASATTIESHKRYIEELDRRTKY